MSSAKAMRQMVRLDEQYLLGHYWHRNQY